MTKRMIALLATMLLVLGMTGFAAMADSPEDLTGDPEADGWVFGGNSMENGVYVRGVLNASYDIYTTTFEVGDPDAFDVRDHGGEAYDDYYRDVPSSRLWDPSEAREWEAGHTVVAVGGRFTDIDAEEAGWGDDAQFTGNEVNAALGGNMRYQAKFGTADATWTPSTVAPDQGDGSGSTGDGGNATFLVRTTGSPHLTGGGDQAIGAKHSGEIMGLQQTNHISVGQVGADAVRLIWNWNDDEGYIDSWQILMNTTLVVEDLAEAGFAEGDDYLLTGEGDPIVTTVQRGGNPFTDGLVNLAAPEVADELEARDDCRDGGYEKFGFKNQGRCIQFVNTGKDSR